MHFPRNFWVVISILLAVSCAATVSYVTRRNPPSIAAQVAACANNGLGVPYIDCLRSTIRKLVKEHSTSELMREVTSNATLPGGCHIAGHIIGQETFNKTSNIEQALLECTPDCFRACLHGVVQEAVEREFSEKYPDEDIAHASGPEIEKIGEKYCERRSTCHAVGHLLYVVYNDIGKALSGCERVATSSSRQMNCAGGVFMQASGGLEVYMYKETAPENTKVLELDDYLHLCNTVPDKYKNECFIETFAVQDQIFYREGITDYGTRATTMASACESEKVGPVARAGCFQTIGQNMYKDAKVTDDNSAAIFCSQYKTANDRKSCVLGRVYWLTNFTTFAKTGDYCAALGNELRDFCYDTVFTFISTQFSAATDGPTMCTNVANTSLCEAEKNRYEASKNSIPNYRYGLYGNLP